MNVIKRKTLVEYGITYGYAKSQLDVWYHDVDKAAWNGPQDIKVRYSSASFLRKNIVIFNIKGNRYRLVVKVDYLSQFVFIKWFGTHADYDKQKF